MSSPQRRCKCSTSGKQQHVRGQRDPTANSKAIEICKVSRPSALSFATKEISKVSVAQDNLNGYRDVLVASSLKFAIAAGIV